MLKGEPRRISIHNVGKFGVIIDTPAHMLPPEAWSAANNIRFYNNVAYKAKGKSAVFGTPSVTPGFLLNAPSQGQSYWLYTSLAKCYVYEGGVHTNITRQTAGVDVDYTATTYNQWNGGILGGIPILNNGVDIPQYWPTINIGTKLANLSNWPSTLRAKVVKPYGAFLVALNINDNSSLYPQMFWWSDRTDPGQVPGSWDYTDATTFAGRKELTDIKGGDLVDGVMLGGSFVLYKESSTHIMRYIGGQEIMGNDLILPSTGLLAPRCAVPYSNDRGHFVVTQNDFIVHSGQPRSSEALLDGRLRTYIFNNIDTNNYKNSFCFMNAAMNEIWFCFPTSGQTYPNVALIWNWKYNTTQIRDFSGVHVDIGAVQEAASETWASVSGAWSEDIEPWSRQSRQNAVIADVTNTAFYQVDSGEIDSGTTMESYLERTGLAIIGRDREGNPRVDFGSRKLVTRVWPKISGTAEITVRLGAQESRDDSVTWQSSGVFNPATDKYIDLVAQGRLIAIRFESIASQAWQIEGYDLLLSMLGEH